MNRYRCVVRKGLCGIEDTMAIRVRVFHDEQGFTEVIDGRELMAQLEALARSLGAQAIQLSAQEGAVGFYERLGYAAFGEWYMDEHCPHRDMTKTL